MKIKKILSGLMILSGGGLLLSGCNSGASTSTGGGQSASATPIVAPQAASSLFASNSCLTAQANFPSSSSLWWYSGSTITIKNSCSTSQDLSNVGFSLSSQDSAGNAVSIGTFNNWWYNGDSYAINFTGGSTQTGSITTGNKTTPTILANNSIVFTGGGWNLSNATYNSTLATNSFAMNGGGVTPVNQYGTLNIAIDTTNTNCLGTSVCSGKVNAIVTNSSNVQVGTISVPDTSLGGIYTQPITKLSPGTYTVSASGLADTTIVYNPTNAQGVVNVNESTSVTVKYNKVAPAINYGVGKITLSNLVSGYTGTLSFKIINTKDNSTVGTYSLAQGSSVTTDNIPVSDNTHAYSVQIDTGIADPVNGNFYVESGNSTLSITKDATTAFTIPMVKSSIANKNVTVAISGLDGSDTASTTFSDATGKYVYANPVSKTNGSTTYKIESGLNLGTSVKAIGSTTYTVNPINNTGVVSADKTITDTFVKYVAPVSTATYNYTMDGENNFEMNNNGVTLSFNGITKANKLVVKTNYPVTPGYSLSSCFKLNYTTTVVANTQVGNDYVMTITDPKGIDLTSTCTLMGYNAKSAEVTGLSGTYIAKISSVSADDVAIPLYSPCSSTGCKDPGNGYVNSGYYADWSVWSRGYKPGMIPFNNLNNIIFAFIGFDTSGNLRSLDGAADSAGLTIISKAIKQYPYLQTHLSFGGWTNGTDVYTAPMFYALATDPTATQNYTKNIVALLRSTGMSGVDVDWEWWSPQGQTNATAPAKQMLSFYKAIRTALDTAGKADGKTYTFTIAVNGGVDRILALQGKNVDGTSNGNPNAVSNFWSQVNGLVDNINVMNYDYHGGFDTGAPAYFQAPYTFQNTGSYAVGKDSGWSIQDSMTAYTANGVTAKKLVAGIPLYVRTMGVSSAGNNGGLFQNVTGTGVGDYEQGIFDYKCLVNPVNNPVTGCGTNAPVSMVKGLTFYDSTSNTGVFNQYGLNSLQPWGYNSATGTFVTYDNTWSASQKAQKVKANGLGGTMFWEIDGDSQNSNTSIIQAVKNTYN